MKIAPDETYSLTKLKHAVQHIEGETLAVVEQGRKIPASIMRNHSQVVASGVFRGLSYLGVAMTVYDVGRAAHKSIENKSAKPIIAETICMHKPSVFLSAIEYSGMFGKKKIVRFIDCVPHCEKHGEKKFAQLGVVLYSCPNSSKYKSLRLISTNLEFLTETKKMNLKGDIFPPWIVYPGIDSTSGYWRQGNGEGILSEIWRPFWKNLSPTEKKDYIEKWKPNQDWMKHIEFLDKV